MLARLELAGIDVGGRWDAAASVVREQAGGSVLAFVDAHYALALGAVPRAGGARQHRARARRGRPRRLRGHGRLARQGPCAASSRASRRCASELRRIGGSHAQRDLFALLLLDSAVAAGESALAAALLAERARCGRQPVPARLRPAA